MTFTVNHIKHNMHMTKHVKGQLTKSYYYKGWHDE